MAEEKIAKKWERKKDEKEEKEEEKVAFHVFNKLKIDIK